MIAFDGVQIALESVGAEHDKLIDEVEAPASDVGLGVLSVHAQCESHNVHGVGRGVAMAPMAS